MPPGSGGCGNDSQHVRAQAGDAPRHQSWEGFVSLLCLRLGLWECGRRRVGKEECKKQENKVTCMGGVGKSHMG